MIGLREVGEDVIVPLNSLQPLNKPLELIPGTFVKFNHSCVLHNSFKEKSILATFENFFDKFC